MEPHDLEHMFDALAPTAEQEQAVLDRLLQMERKGRPMKKLKKLTVLGVAAALMVISCAAAVVTGIDQRFLDFFGMTAEQEPLLSPTAIRVEKFHTYENGWTVDVRQALSDRYSMAFVIDVTAPEEMQPGWEKVSWLFIDPHLQGDTDGHYTRSLRQFDYGYMEDEASNRASYLFRMDYSNMETDVDLLGSTWELTPEQFEYTDQDGIVHEVALGGWTCAISLSGQDPGILYEIGQPISLQTYETAETALMPQPIPLQTCEMTLEQLYISPISVAIRLKVILPPERDIIDLENCIVLHKDSGETVETEYLMHGDYLNWEAGIPNVRHLQFGLEEFKECIDPTEITAVTICGQTFELK